ncbi:kinase-like domain-containing protein [Rhizophagus irregularis DAOM 181602=DAOM 197198]|nr:kinase-like domain-containing protein [Rhizophagus irregularis DAOM 181602=DAOM 197198]
METELKAIGEGGFAKVYSASWYNGKSAYEYVHGIWKKREPKPTKVALKRLNGSQNISDKYLNELKIHWEISNKNGLKFYGLTKCPKTKEFMMIMEFANKGSLRSNLSNNFNNTTNLLPKPVNSSIITSYVNNEVCDSQLIDLEISNSIQLRDTDDEIN